MSSPDTMYHIHAFVVDSVAYDPATNLHDLPDGIVMREDGWLGGYKYDGEPIVDYVYVPEPVRCKDCKHSYKDGTLCKLFAGYAPIAGGDEYEMVPADVEPNGFCSWGVANDGRAKPCPWCGEVPKVEHRSYNDIIYCWSPRCPVHPNLVTNRGEDIIELWNRREGRMDGAGPRDCDEDCARTH